LATDYTCHILGLGLVYLLLRNAATPFPIPFRLAVPSSKSLSVALAGAAILIAANVVGVTFFRHLDAHSWRLTRFPAPTNLALQFFDVTAGVVLAAICEEIVFRFYFMNLFLLRGASMRMTIVLSTLIFAAIHWSYGASTAIFAAFAGLLFSIGFIGTGNLAVPIIAHAVFDAVFFAGGIDALWRIYNQT
jgi:membrane protease YdiL (CAAX protease family)